MSTNLDKLVEGIRSKRSEKLPQAKARLEKLKAAKKAVLTTRTRAAAVAANNPDLQAKLNGVRYEAVLQLLDVAISTTQQAFDRLDRPSIHIGVAGKSRQGKSQILQMLTGLADQQIPTGDGMPCTAARSIIHNVSMTAAKVHYLTKDGILEKKVYPSYAPKGTSKFALGFPTPRPASLEVFLSMSLPTVETSDGTSTSAETNWKKVENLQKDLRAHPELVSKLGAAAEDIDITHVRDYIVKDNGEVLHNVVDRIEMWTPFDIGLPEGLTVYDLPGLGDPTPGIREDMLKSLKKEADVVLFMRKAVPDGEGEYWHHEDDDAFDDMKSIYSVEDVKPAEWIQLVLNLDSRNGHVNARNTENLRKTVAKGFVPVVCDCGSKDAVRAMINENIERLVGNVSRIDDLRIRQADADYSAAMSEIRSLYAHLSEVNFSIVSDEKWFDQHMTQFMGLLKSHEGSKSSFQKFKEVGESILRTSLNGALGKVKRIYTETEKVDSYEFPAELPIFSRRWLTDKMKEADDAHEYIGSAVRNQREALLAFIRHELSGCCEELLRAYYKEASSVLFSNRYLEKFFDSTKSDASPRDRISWLAEAFCRIGTAPSLTSALQDLLNFSLTFESVILPPLYGVEMLVTDFNPDPPSDELRCVRSSLDDMPKSERGAVLYNWLKDRSLALFSELAPCGNGDTMVAKISEYVSNAMIANYSAFDSRFCFGDDCKYEWRSIVRTHLAQLWPEEYANLIATSATATAWRDAIRALSEFVK